jgi:hypothetical protein
MRILASPLAVVLARASTDRGIGRPGSLSRRFPDSEADGLGHGHPQPGGREHGFFSNYDSHEQSGAGRLQPLTMR